MSKLRVSLIYIQFLILLVGTSSLKFSGIPSLCPYLPSPRYGAVPIFEGIDSVLLLGGSSSENVYIDEILRYNFTTKVYEVIESLPQPRGVGAAAADSSGNIFYFGGKSSSDIYKITPVDTGVSVTVLETQLPRNTWGLSAATIGEFIYLFGGESDLNVRTTDILQFNPTTTSLIKVGAFPSPHSHFQGSAVPTPDGFIYLFGGDRENRDILQFNSNTFGVEIVNGAKHPEFIVGNTAVLVEDLIYDIGGMFETDKGQSIRDSLISFNITSHEVTEVSVPGYYDFLIDGFAVYLPENNKIYTFGGSYQPQPLIAEEVVLCMGVEVFQVDDGGETTTGGHASSLVSSFTMSIIGYLFIASM